MAEGMGVVAVEGVRRSRSPVPVYHLDEAFLPSVFDVPSLSVDAKEEGGCCCRSFPAGEDAFEPPPPPPPQISPIVPKPSQLCSWGAEAAAEGLEEVALSDGVDLCVLIGSGGRRETRRRRREGGNDEDEDTW